VLMLTLLKLFALFGRTKFIINANYEISTMVVFCPGGLLSGIQEEHPILRQQLHGLVTVSRPRPLLASLTTLPSLVFMITDFTVAVAYIKLKLTILFYNFRQNMK